MLPSSLAGGLPSSGAVMGLGLIYQQDIDFIFSCKNRNVFVEHINFAGTNVFIGKSFPEEIPNKACQI